MLISGFRALVVCDELADVARLVEPYREFSVIDPPRCEGVPVVPNPASLPLEEIAKAYGCTVDSIRASRRWPVVASLEAALSDPVARGSFMFQVDGALYEWRNQQGHFVSYRLDTDGHMLPVSEHLGLPAARVGDVRWDMVRKNERVRAERIRTAGFEHAKRLGFSDELLRQIMDSSMEDTPEVFASRWAHLDRDKMTILLRVGEPLMWASLEEAEFDRILDNCYTLRDRVFFESGLVSSVWRRPDGKLAAKGLVEFYGTVSAMLEVLPRDKLLVNISMMMG